MWTILFDIDGTLIRTRGAGFAALQRAMTELYGIDEIPKVEVRGRTDYGIIGDLFRPFDLDLDSEIDNLKQRYWEYLPEALAAGNGILLNGAKELVELLSQRSDVALGIITGNTAKSAEMKLRHFGLDEYFSFGGYGDHDADRNQVAQLAFEAAQEQLGADFDPEKLWMLGDTPNDVRCARFIGAKVVAVLTGGCGREELTMAEPDILVPEFSEPRHLVDRMLGEM